MARKNISIGLDTWQELAALGRFGMTFDDIVKILLTEHRELDKLRSRLQAQEVEPEQAIRELFNEVDKVTPPAGYYRAAFGATKTKSPRQPQQQPTQPQSQQQQQEQKSNLLEKDIAQPSLDEIIKNEFMILLPEIKYPINKEGLILFIKEFENEFREKYNKIPLRVEQTLFVVENLPDMNKLYGNTNSLEGDLINVVNNKEIAEKLLGKPGKIVGCSVAHFHSEENKNAVMKKMIEYDDRDRQHLQKMLTQ